jgi:hypothetical protein
MKKSFLAVFVASAALAVMAVAGSVYDRTLVTLGTATGTATYTNTTQYAAIALKRLWIQGNSAAAATVTVTRVTSGGAYTQAVGTVVCSSGAGNSASLTAAYLKPGDALAFANSTATGAVAMVEYEVQQH